MNRPTSVNLHRSSSSPPKLAVRLEYVRREAQSRTLKDFWRRLTGDGSYDISYEAVRNYHSHRDPPVDYLVQVSRVFGVSLKWLATGEGNPWHSNGYSSELAQRALEKARKQEFEDALREVFFYFDSLPPLAMAMVLKTCERLHRDAHFRAGLSQRTGPTRAYIGRFVGKALAGPLVNAVAGTVRVSDLTDWQLESFVNGVCQALLALVPNPNVSERKFVELPH